MISDASIAPVDRVKKLSQKASDFPYDTKIPVMRYIRSTKEMERMALIYAEENEIECGFLLYMKLIILLVEKLPKHPGYKGLNPNMKKTIKKTCDCAFVAAEKLKSLLKAEFQKEYDQWLIKEEERKKYEEELIKQNEQKKTEEQTRQEELNLQEKARKQAAATVTATSATFNNITIPDIASLDNTESFPSVPSVTERVQPTAPPPSAPSSEHLNSPNHLPPYSPQQSSLNNNGVYISQQPPSYEDAFNDISVSTNELPKFDRSNKPSQFSTPEVNRNTKPDEFIYRQDSTSLDGNRQVVIPPDLVPRFLQLASNNTTRNLETCGILTGKLSRNAFRITHLVIPKQSATSDSCTTESEEDLFDVQDKHNLITLGWIHTHPSQTAFLSSVDLHTQCSYQQLMPEAIAIVCSPKYNTIGMYRLTPHYGVNFVASCTKPGFHPHPKEPPLYEESPLVSVDNGFNIDVIDLR